MADLFWTKEYEDGTEVVGTIDGSPTGLDGDEGLHTAVQAVFEPYDGTDYWYLLAHSQDGDDHDTGNSIRVDLDRDGWNALLSLAERMVQRIDSLAGH